MKKLIASLAAAVGMSSTLHAAEKVEKIDAGKLQYSLPTVSADRIEYVAPSKESFEGAPQFHEDEWAQLEFFPKSRFAEIQSLLKEYKSFEKANRTQFGWSKIYARKLPRTPLVAPSISIKRLSSETSYQLLPSPILFAGSKPLGQVKDGFTLKLGTNAYLYGLGDSKGISVLAAHLAGADDMLLTRAFTVLHKSYDLILVDWRQQFVLVSVASNGQFNVWRP